MADMQVRDNTDRSRYEITVDGKDAGFADYRVQGDVVEMPHTVVNPEFEGKGVGSALARGALDDIRSKGHTVRPTCSFIRGYIEKHPEYQDLQA